MILQNKLGITDSAELAREEERISKKRARELFENSLLEAMEPGGERRLPDGYGKKSCKGY